MCMCALVCTLACACVCVSTCTSRVRRVETMLAAISKGATVKAREGYKGYKVGFLCVLREAGRRGPRGPRAGGGRDAAGRRLGGATLTLHIAASSHLHTHIYIHLHTYTPLYEASAYRLYRGIETRRSLTTSLSSWEQYVHHSKLQKQQLGLYVIAAAIT